MRIFALPLAVLVLAGCGGNSSSSSSAPFPAAPAAGGAKVTATETEYRIALSRTSLAPGATTFVVVNKGTVAHSLEIDGPGVSDKKLSSTVAPGGSMSLTVTLQKGTYELYCPVDGHKQLGMDTKIGVGGAAVKNENETTTSRGNGY
jgi:plastocyanin